MQEKAQVLVYRHRYAGEIDRYKDGCVRAHDEAIIWDSDGDGDD